MDNDALRTMSWRERIYVIIFFTNTPAGKLFDTTLLFFIFASLVVVMLDSVAIYNDQYGGVLDGLEWLFTGVFLIEYLVRIYCHPEPRKYVVSFYGAIDVLSVVPAFIALLYPDAEYLLVVRAIRMLRVFRVLKLTQYLSQANFLLVALRGSKQKIVVFLLSVTTLVLIYGTLMYVIEGPSNGFTSIPMSIYWAVVTITTVGFGDIVPHTPLGKAVATLVMITGYSIIAVPTGIFTAELATAMRADSLQHRCPSCEKLSHEPNASFCSRCGTQLFKRKALHDEDAQIAHDPQTD
ncbi:ion transporter [Stutzerimonas xanthomarina]|uniref:Voltage-gated potassium channel n=2 Tax=Stutzerimonas xanthomarina TaxID=271420 RepID=A0A1M5N5L1_9GAMM|nr:ion transporter [Stutzerimonas xanthomarina]MCP9337854.1 ion transporter [Stutzerimonas xanthomarina]SEH82960.1 voltage-gated potassium channel [Stutzerimonas xanthomarina]SHG84801.1 voltage-gated potassium channel [Stutzerimonas xanthomarina DSM 18231]